MARRKTSKMLGVLADKKQAKNFEKCITSSSFAKRWLCQQWIAGNHDFKILNFNEDQTCWFCVLDKSYFLYNEVSKVLLYYGTLFDDQNPPKINSSKEIPWKEIEEARNAN